MITKQVFGFLVECDSCSETLDVEEDFFNEALDAMKRDGWKTTKVDGGWEHSCPCCVEAERDARNDFTVN